ncbi:hypothetical protein IC232_27315 [Microvirga sp. BT688]|uniref:hypothetical protein n=1 Tax=Microvirga sp. TaxID=1873136 RepID=UPI0016867B3B|nr:hypothetical protein [Microvirga sp.]MBD2750373.1 hypothetical protein [Microvirga sp.]
MLVDICPALLGMMLIKLPNKRNDQTALETLHNEPSSGSAIVSGGTMHLHFRAPHLIYSALLVISVGATSYVAYRMVGFLGVGVLGLIIGVIALTVEMERGGPVGHGQASSLYAQHIAAVERMSPSERAERRAEIKSAAFPLLVAKIVSGGLIAFGFGLFFILELGA